MMGFRAAGLALAVLVAGPVSAQQTGASAPVQSGPADPAPVSAPAPEVSPAATAPMPAPEAAPLSAATPLPVSPAPTTDAAAPVSPSVPAPAAGAADPSVALAPVAGGGDAGANPTLPHDLSPWGMFMAADIVVQGVMVGLAFASVVTWTVLLVKMLELWGAGRRAARSLRMIADADSLHDALVRTGKRRDPASAMIRAAVGEYDRSLPAVAQAGGAGLKERVTSHLARIEAVAARRIARGTGVLATIGSTAPFVGLFGTVWGIMNSFIGISQAQTTNLAVVAPGIAEALLATAIGLVAAIPAVVIYNLFARAITGYRLRLANAAAGVERLVSRDLDLRSSMGA